MDDRGSESFMADGVGVYVAGTRLGAYRFRLWRGQCASGSRRMGPRLGVLTSCAPDELGEDLPDRATEVEVQEGWATSVAWRCGSWR